MTILHAFTNQYQFQKRFQFKPVSVQRKVGAAPERKADVAHHELEIRFVPRADIDGKFI